MPQLTYTEGLARVRAASGASLEEVLREVVRLKNQGLAALVSLAAPLGDRELRALTEHGASVRVEPLENWVEATSHSDELYVVGPTRSAAATWKRVVGARLARVPCAA